MAYSQWTYDSPNRLKRFSHRRRYARSVELLSRWLAPDATVVDWGCADGYLLRLLADSGGAEGVTAVGYEPYPDDDNRPVAGVEVVTDYEALQRRVGQADAVSCFEVFEHLSAERQRTLTAEICGVLRPGGMLVISVPIETGPVGVVKGLTRFSAPQLRKLYTAKRLWLTLLGRPIPDVRTGHGYLPHLGFRFRDLAPILSERFDLVETQYSPLPLAPKWMQSQLFTVWRRL